MENGDRRPENHPPFQSRIGFQFQGGVCVPTTMCEKVICVMCVLQVIGEIVIRSRNQSITNTSGGIYS